jgi:hypothetical protein
MNYTDDQNHLRVTFRALGCTIPGEELARMERGIELLGAGVRQFPEARLTVRCIHHPRSKVSHVECELRLPGMTLFDSDYDEDYRIAFDRSIRKIGERLGRYLDDDPDRRAGRRANSLDRLDRDVVAPEGHDAGPVGTAVEDGDYRTFRRLLSGYEEWLRNRIGRWVQRFPDAQAQVGNRLRLGDLLEEVYLNAFEHYPEWPTTVPFHEWLDGLIGPSLKEFLRKPDEEAENASMARSLRDANLR